MLKLMYITNNPEIVKLADKAGVDRIFVDLEYIGKDERQSGLDTVKSKHSVCDVKTVKENVKNAKVLVRVNPIHDKTEEYSSSEEEIEEVIEAGADIIMLPYFKTVKEVKRFLTAVGGRCKTMLLIETVSAVANLDEILSLDGVEEIHIGLNDLSIELKQKFLFTPLAYGVIDFMAEKIRAKNIPFGFGGIARLGFGDIPAENIICEHYRLGSDFAILSRSFCNANKVSAEEIETIFVDEVKKIREYEKTVESYTSEQFEKNREVIIKAVEKISKRVETK